MAKKTSKGTNIRVTDEAHKLAVEHTFPKIKLGLWVSEAITEKIEREKMQAPTLHRQFVDKKVEHKFIHQEKFVITKDMLKDLSGNTSGMAIHSGDKDKIK